MGKEDSSMFPSLVYRTGFAPIACAAYILLAPAAKAEQDVWPVLRQQTFGDRQIQAEDGQSSSKSPEPPRTPRSCP